MSKVIFHNEGLSTCLSHFITKRWGEKCFGPMYRFSQISRTRIGTGWIFELNWNERKALETFAFKKGKHHEKVCQRSGNCWYEPSSQLRSDFEIFNILLSFLTEHEYTVRNNKNNNSRATKNKIAILVCRNIWKILRFKGIRKKTARQLFGNDCFWRN